MISDYKRISQTDFPNDAPIKGVPTEEDELKYGIIINKYPKWIIPDVRFSNELATIKSKDGISIRVNRHIANRYPDIALSCIDRNWSRDLIEVKDLINLDPHEKLIMNDIELYNPRLFAKLVHPSETQLDYQQFDYYIDNNGSLADLLEQVKSLKLWN